MEKKNLFHLPLGKFHSNEFLFLSEIDTSFSECAAIMANQSKLMRKIFLAQCDELYLVNFEGLNELHMWGGIEFFFLCVVASLTPLIVVALSANVIKFVRLEIFFSLPQQQQSPLSCEKIFLPNIFYLPL